MKPKVGLTTILGTNTHPTISIICPFSRAWMVDRWFENLLELNVPFSEVGLFIYVDNNRDDLFNKVLTWCAKLAVMSKMYHAGNKVKHDMEKIGSIKIYYSGREPLRDEKGYLERRERIAAIHDDIKKYVFSKYIFGLEDDTLIPRTAFYKLYNHLLEIPNVGFVTGTEVGRWGFEYIGAWQVNEEDEFGKVIDISTVKFKETGVRDVDAAGMYCFITRLGFYKNHNFLSYKAHDFYGPDVAFCLFIRKKGHRVILDYDVQCEHYKDANTVLRPTDEEVCEVRFRKSNNWNSEITYEKRSRHLF